MSSNVTKYFRAFVMIVSLLILICPSISVAQQNQVYVINGAHQDIDNISNLMGYSNQLKDHIELIERNPDVRFCMGNTYNLKHFLKVYPEYEDRLKALMQQGKISSPAQAVAYEPGWYSGEYLVRSVAYIKHWLKSTLGYDSHWVHLNDSPSITPQFAQILEKSDVDLLVHNANRLGWPPVGNPFYYGALDGSRVLIDMSSYNDLLYLCSELRPDYLIKEIKLDKNFGRLKLKLGQAISDWGTDAHLSLGLAKNIREWNKKYAEQYNFSMHFKTIEDFAVEINKRIADQEVKVPEMTGTVDPWPWSGQPYGRYGSYHRAAAETMLPTVEKLSSICNILGISSYPAEKINQAWDHIMWTTDHNWGWNPGKKKSNKDAYDIAQQLLKQKLAEFAQAVKWESKGVPIVVFNPLNWVRSEAVQINTKLPEKMDWMVVEHSGKPVLSQELSSENNGDGTKTVQLLFWANYVPSIGYKTFYVVAKNNAQPTVSTSLKAGEGYIENEYYKISADQVRGVKSIYDKLEKRELIDAKSAYPFGFSSLAIHSLKKRPVQIKHIESHNGPLMAELELQGLSSDYPVTVKIILQDNSPRIDIDILADYSGAPYDKRYEKKKYFFADKSFHTFITPFKLPDYSMQLGIPYGSIPNISPTRYTSTKLSQRSPASAFIVGGMFTWKKKYSHEMSAWHKDIQKWFTMGNAKYSVDVALIDLETRTYMLGEDKKLPAIHLKWGAKPRKYSWQLALRGHSGNWQDANAPRFGWECSNPLLAVVPSDKGALPPEASFITVDAPAGNVVLSTFKQAFDGNGYVLRFYETYDKDTQVKISINPLLNIPRDEVSRTNLLEEPFETLPLLAQVYSIPTLSQGIETLRFFKTAVTDVRQPAAITDLKLTDPTSASFNLGWSASGDDGKKGTAHEYQIGYSTKPINEQNWSRVPKVKHPPQPKTSGAGESFRVSGLEPQTKYYFSIRVSDEVGNQSSLSNIVYDSTQEPDNTPPAVITDLSVVHASATSVTLSWTAPGDDQLKGQASYYDFRYGDEMIDATTWEDASEVTPFPTPGSPRAQEKYSVTGLEPATTYYFAIKGGDEANNFSPISKVAVGQTGKFKQLALQNGLMGYSGCKDTYISHVNEEESVVAYGDSQTIRNWAGGTRSILIKFDLSQIPKKAKIHSATLGLYCYDITYGDEGTTQCYRLTTPWDQSQANWWQADKKHKWKGGQIDRATDYGLGPNGMIANSQVKDGGHWVNFPVTPVVRDWVSGKYPNFGWQIMGNCNEDCGIYYHSAEHQQKSALRPILKIKYDPIK